MQDDERDLAERLDSGLAVVTGATGGLGRALVLELLHRGLTVAAVARDAAALEALQREGGARLLTFRADLSQPAQIAEAFAQMRQRAPVTRLVNCAALYPHRDLLRETPESFAATMDVNVGAAFACTRAALDDMCALGAGRVVNVGSFADLAPLPGSGAYSVSKGAMRLLTRAFVSDLGARFPDIVFSDWMPGMLATRMGPPDGLAPKVAARWGAGLLLWQERSLNGTIFEQDREVPPPMGRKARLKALLTGRRPRPRQIPAAGPAG